MDSPEQDSLAYNFLIGNSFCVLAVKHPDGWPHASMMHFAPAARHFDIYLATSSASRKAEALVNDEVQASVVAGSVREWKTLQMDGTLKQIIDPLEIEKAKKAIYAKYPADSARESNDTIFLHFTPVWRRYADFTTTPPLILPWGNHS